MKEQTNLTQEDVAEVNSNLKTAQFSSHFFMCTTTYIYLLIYLLIILFF